MRPLHQQAPRAAPPPITLQLTLDPVTSAFSCTAPPNVPRWVLYGMLQTATELLIKQGLEDKVESSSLVLPIGRR